MNQTRSLPLTRNNPRATKRVNLLNISAKNTPQQWSSRQIDCTFQVNRVHEYERSMIGGEERSTREGFLNRHLLSHFDLASYDYRTLVDLAKKKTEHSSVVDRKFHTFILATTRDIDSAFFHRAHFVEGAGADLISGFDHQRFVSTTCFMAITVLLGTGDGRTFKHPIVLCNEVYPVVRILSSKSHPEWPIFKHMFGILLKFSNSGFYASKNKLLSCCTKLEKGMNLATIAETLKRAKLPAPPPIDLVCVPTQKGPEVSTPSSTDPAFVPSDPRQEMGRTELEPTVESDVRAERAVSVTSLDTGAPPPHKPSYVEIFNSRFERYCRGEYRLRLTSEVAIDIFEFMKDMAFGIEANLSDIGGMVNEYSETLRDPKATENDSDELIKLITHTSTMIENLNSVFEYLVPRRPDLGVTLDTENSKGIDLDSWIFHIDSYFGLIVAGFLHHLEKVSAPVAHLVAGDFNQPASVEYQEVTILAGDLLRRVFWQSMDMVDKLLSKFRLQLANPVKKPKGFIFRPVQEPDDPKINVACYLQEVRPIEKAIDALEADIRTPMTAYFDMYLDMNDKLVNEFVDSSDRSKNIIYLYPYAADCTIEYGKVSSLIDYRWEMIDRA